jgi:type IX secretion system substrate protein
MKKNLLLAITILLFSSLVFAQDAPFSVIEEWSTQQSAGFEAGDVVQFLNSTSSTDVITFGATSQFGPTPYKVVAVLLDATHFVIVFDDKDNNDYGTAIIAEISGNTITYGTEVVFKNDDIHSFDVDRLDDTHFVLAYSTGTSSWDDREVIIGTVSGISVTFGAINDFGSAFRPYYIQVVATDATHIVITFRDQNNSAYATAFAGIVSGDNISFGSGVVFNSVNTQNLSMDAMDATHVVVSYQNITDPNSPGISVIGTISGNSISFGAIVQFATKTQYSSIATLDATRFVINYQDGSNGYFGTSKIGTVSGTNITYGSAYVFLPGWSSYLTTSKLDANNFILAYRDGTNSNLGTAIMGTVTGTSIAFNTSSVYSTNRGEHNNVMAIDNSHFAVAYTNVIQGGMMSPDTVTGHSVIGTIAPAIPPVDIINFPEEDGRQIINENTLKYTWFVMPNCVNYDLYEIGANIDVTSGPGVIKLAIYAQDMSLQYESPEITVAGGVEEYVSYTLPPGSFILNGGEHYTVAIFGDPSTADNIFVDAASSFTNLGVATNLSTASWAINSGITYPTFPDPLFYNYASYRTISPVIKGYVYSSGNTAATDVQTTCDSYTWIDGNTYTANNNTATYTMSNAAGCDSIITLDLTVNYSTAGTDTQTACDSFTWIDGLTYTSSNNTATHTLTNALGCDSIVTLDLTVNYSVVVTPSVSACDSAEINGTWYYTSQQITELYPGGASNGCDSTVLTTLTVQDSPTAGAGTDATICENANQTLAGVVTNELSTLWTSSGDGTFDDATLLAATYTPGTADIGNGTVTLTLTAYSLAPCVNSASDDVVISIQQLPTANAGTDATICEVDTYPLSGSASDQQNVLWTTSGDGTFDDATLLAATYTPGSTDIVNGTSNLTLTSYSIAPCANSANDLMVLTIQNSPIADAGPDDDFCATGSYALNGVASYEQSTLWSSSGDGAFDDASLLNATYTPGTNDLLLGTVDLGLTAYAMSPCGTDAMDMLTLTVQDDPEADAGQDGILCETGQYTLSGIAANEQSTLWTSNGDGSFDDASLLTATYSPGTNDIANGTVVLTLTAHSIAPCTVDVSDDMTLTIQYLPMADAGTDATICNDESYTMVGSSSYSSSILWTSAGDGTFDDPTLLNANYAPGANDLANESVILTLTANATSPCATSTSDDMLLSILADPTSNAGPDAQICSNETHTLNGSANNEDYTYWNSLGDGDFDDRFILNATYTPGPEDIENGEVELVLVAYGFPSCYSEIIDDMILSIEHTATANAGADAFSCEDDPFTLNGMAEYNSGQLWTSAGDGTFNDASALNAIYTPGLNDIELGEVELTLTAFGNANCPTDASDNMTLGIEKGPDQPAVPVGPQVVDLNTTASSEYSIEEVANASQYQWHISPSEAGTIEGASTLATVNWNVDYLGLIAYISVGAKNETCPAVLSDALTVNVGHVGIEQGQYENLNISILPNPSNGLFNIAIEGSNNSMDLFVVNSRGQVILKKELDAQNSSHKLDLSSMKPGLYFLKFVNNKGVSIKKVIKK